MSNNKFRSWGGGYKRFYYFDNGIYYNSIKCYEPGFSMCSFFDWDNAEQFTGLTDKNGKEIYEGDVVKIDANYAGDHYIGEETKTVLWDCEEAMFYVDSCKDGLWNNNSEIIGNIHEATK